jgi:hypothetical protein
VRREYDSGGFQPLERNSSGNWVGSATLRADVGRKSVAHSTEPISGADADTADYAVLIRPTEFAVNLDDRAQFEPAQGTLPASRSATAVSANIFTAYFPICRAAGYVAPLGVLTGD